MKVIVDELPKKPEDCVFSDYVGMTGRCVCFLKSGIYSRCDLDMNKECPHLKKGESHE